MKKSARPMPKSGKGGGAMSFPRYERYRDSGVEWLGEVPEHWESEKGKWLFERMNRPVRSEDDVVTAFRDGQVTLRTNRRTDGFTNAIKEHGYQGIRKGDLVIHSMDAFAGAIGVSESDGKSTPVYSACVPRKPDSVSPEFYACILRYMAHSGFITTLAKGIRERSTDFRFNDFGALDFPLPPKFEQDRIVAFLDRKTAEIDALIAKKQRQIELLGEQKAILINRAVTRGLNPKAKLKPSGIEWIGEIPEHWGCVPLRRLIDGIDQGVSPATTEGEVGGNAWGVLKSGCCNGGIFREGEHKKLPPKFKFDSSIIVKAGDLLVSRACGSRDLVGSTAMVPKITTNLILSDKNFRLQLRGNIDRTFLKWSMNSFHYRRQIEPKISGAEGLPNNIPGSRLKEVVMPLPPLAEQLIIVRGLDGISRDFNLAEISAGKQIESLKTLRRTLIAHAVTGKIKV